MATETKVTGRSAKSRTGFNVKGAKMTLKVGSRVEILSSRDAGDGGDVTFYAYGTVVGIAVGTEYGMNGTTAIASVAWDRYYDMPARTGLIAARRLSLSSN